MAIRSSLRANPPEDLRILIADKLVGSLGSVRTFCPEEAVADYGGSVAGLWARGGLVGDEAKPLFEIMFDYFATLGVEDARLSQIEAFFERRAAGRDNGGTRF